MKLGLIRPFLLLVFQECSAEYKEIALAAGMNDYLTKPYTKKEFMKKLTFIRHLNTY